MISFRLGTATVILLTVAIASRGAIVGTTTHAHGDFGSPGSVVQGILAGDLLEQAGVVGMESSATGWHPATPAEPGRFIQLTDGAGPASDLYGIVNDFSPAPVNVFTYQLAGASDLAEIRLVGGNYNEGGGEGDGRIFITAVIEASTNGGASYVPLGGANGTGYYQSDPSGAINVSGNPANISGDFLNSFEETLLSISDDSAPFVVTGATHVRVSIFDADNTQGQNRDPYDGVNPYTGVDDGLTKGFVGPLLWEIDVIGSPSVAIMPDLNMDGFVDIFDVNVVSANWGGSGPAGDANKDGTVDIFDVNVISANWSPPPAPVPEPATFVMAAAGAIGLVLGAKRLRSVRLGQGDWRGTIGGR